MKSLPLLAGALLLLAGCTAAQNASSVAAAREGQDRLTLGTVQREVRVGMSGAEVASVLGAPNIVTTDERRRETWVYDRIATERVESRSGGYGSLLIVGAGGSAGASQTSQRTLTVVIKFDEASRVRDFSYRSSSF
jgi:outer membrane protein assembly factor BamE (lipoprotein component of BamABCDE complex)